jgi:hypothetical protein
MVLYKKFVNGYPSNPSPLYRGVIKNNSIEYIFCNEFWFNLELKGLRRLKNETYIPEILSINNKKLSIKFKWHDTNLNHMLNFNKNLPSDWKLQIKNILHHLLLKKIYKINLYPHTFSIRNDKIYITDLYGCLHENDIVLYNDINHIINNKKRFIFKNKILNIKETYYYTIKHNIGLWPENFLNG